MENPERDVERAQEAMDDSIRRLEHERDRLEQDIDESRKELHHMEEATGGEVAGDWRDTDDASGGEDPEGAAKRE
ncbi:hypothetical protein [Capillimicrobium parvum]|uniref:Uncharacterized protein n=1 Tax=Capillimicrobium parvum TaxID=2884022 RepID=A0A9E6XSS1_9ACTN|nr:hypothetical protein [Capillimicrobium parvum]UGS34010.1 hypothetical protein DSM104329_00377 [Capillimicrobium parvum]